MKNLFLVLALFLSASVFSQQKEKFAYVHLSDKSVTLLPFYKVFGSNFDPAISVGGGLEYLHKGSSSIFQAVQATWYTTDMIGAGITLSTSIGYKYQVPAGFFGEFMLGVGATGAISARETFSLDETGQYVKITPVHWTIGIPVDLALGYQFERLAVYCRYTYMVEGIYTDILPILPTSLTGIGLKYRLKGSD